MRHPGFFFPRQNIRDIGGGPTRSTPCAPVPSVFKGLTFGVAQHRPMVQQESPQAGCDI